MFNRDRISNITLIKYYEEKLMKLKVDKYLKEKEIAEQIQKNYSFKIPMYVLLNIVELFELEETNINNVIEIINLAEINNRISKNNAIFLRNDIIDIAKIMIGKGG